MERKVLLLSGRPPIHSAGYVDDTIKLLEIAGCKVDFLTLFNFDGQKENQYNLLKKPIKTKVLEFISKHSWIRIFRCLYHQPYHLFQKLFNRNISLTHGEYLLVFDNEENPPINPEIIFNKIQDIYDFFVILIPQDMITSKSILFLFEKYNKPVLIMCPDMYYFTGNCFFPNSCNNYLEECKDCPAYKAVGLKDKAHNNFVFKKSVFENIKCAFICNTQDFNFVSRSNIISPHKLFVSSFILDVDIFKPYDKDYSRNHFCIPKDKTFIIMARYIDPNNVDWNRKGGDYFLKIMNSLYNRISQEERNRSLLLFVGTKEVNPTLDFKIDTLCVGNLNREDLILAYNASSLFFCSSINDSGPSMVNQSMACSTPVIAFNQGTSIDVLINGVNGYKSDLYDCDSMTDSLVSMLRMDDANYQTLKNNARNTAIKYNSFEAGANVFRKIFSSFENGDL